MRATEDQEDKECSVETRALCSPQCGRVPRGYSWVYKPHSVLLLRQLGQVFIGTCLNEEETEGKEVTTFGSEADLVLLWQRRIEDLKKKNRACGRFWTLNCICG